MSPKKCGHYEGKQVISKAEMVGKIKAAVDARTDENLLIIARTDARAIYGEEEGLRLGGLIGRPGVHRAARHEMITFVNHRPVDSRTLNYALIESYHQSLPKGRYPVAVLTT